MAVLMHRVLVLAALAVVSSADGGEKPMKVLVSGTEGTSGAAVYFPLPLKP
jgi:hypothetical protein